MYNCFIRRKIKRRKPVCVHDIPLKIYNLGGGELLRPLKKMLIVDDDMELVAMLKELMSANHYEVMTASDGTGAVRHVLAVDFDIILCDMVMPRMPGPMFYRAVERARPHLCPRFIFMTGNQADPGVLEFIRSIQGLVLWKPFEIPLLLDTIKLVESKHSVVTE